jgi:protein pelota
VHFVATSGQAFDLATLAMKGRWRHLRRNGAGTVSVTAEDTDDIWALFNIIAPGDEVECATLRKVQMENSQGTTVDTQKIKLVLAVKVEKVDVDLIAGCLRVNGKNVKENKHVKVTGVASCGQ